MLPSYVKGVFLPTLDQYLEKELEKEGQEYLSSYGLPGPFNMESPSLQKRKQDLLESFESEDCKTSPKDQYVTDLAGKEISSVKPNLFNPQKIENSVEKRGDIPESSWKKEGASKPMQVQEDPESVYSTDKKTLAYLEKIDTLESKVDTLLEELSQREKTKEESPSSPKELYNLLQKLGSQMEDLENRILKNQSPSYSPHSKEAKKEETKEDEKPSFIISEMKEEIQKLHQELEWLKESLKDIKGEVSFREDDLLKVPASLGEEEKREGVIPLVIREQDDEITLQIKPLSKRKKISSQWRKVYRKTEDLIQSPEKQQDLLEIFTVGLLKMIWITVMRLGLEVYQTLLMFWTWVDGYFRPSPNRLFQSDDDFSPLQQLVDLLKFGFWIIPTLYFWVYGYHAWAVCYFSGYWLAHYVFKFLFSLMNLRLNLLPSAWEEISMKDYRFRHPFWDLCKVFLVMGPPLYLFYIQEILMGFLYLVVYLAIHFIISLIGKSLSKEWSLLPQPIQKKEESNGME
ncbi:MAG: hypothetical protein D6785_16620 [Planctomycetota bacterium]|nr:MAG: hypothetical protein D6785_16620 [Planctomycetota bacterium]